MSSVTEDKGQARGLEKVREGLVASTKMQKTVVVEVETQKRHPQYGKYVKHTTRYLVHDEANECRPGDRVRIVETRPLSRHKRWRVQKIVERAV